MPPHLRERLAFWKASAPMTKPAESKAQQATVQDLIERLGIPPASICLDWAWQLRQLTPQPHPKLSKQSHPYLTCAELSQAGKTAAKHCDWSQLALDADGKLHWATNAAANTIERDAQCATWLAQLVRWSGSTATASAKTIGTATLEQRTLAWAHAQDATPRSEKPSSSPACIASTVMQAQRSRRRTRPPAKTAQPARNNRRKTILAVGLASLLLACAIFYYVARPLSTPQPSTTQIVPRTLNTHAVKALSDSSNKNSAALPNHALALSTDAIDPASADSSTGSIALHNFLRSSVVSSSASESTPSVVDPALGPSHPAMDATDFISGNTNELASLDLTAERDVLSELSELSKSAEANASEQPLPDAMSETPSASPPPVTLDTFPMNQLQKLDKSLRPRQPLWQLRLAVSEGLEVIPATAQALAEDQRLGWTIRATQPDKPTERKFSDRGSGPKPGTSVVLVQAQLSGKRDPSLRWRIVAASEKYSQVALPLERIWLDQFQDVLSNTASGLQQQVQQLKELSHAAGIPSQTRSSLSAQSRAMETQSKLAAELLEIVADANQMVGWMDGQIEVHGTLLDTAASPATALLQFGNP